MEKGKKVWLRSTEVCPQCKQQVTLKSPFDNSLPFLNMDGSTHRCGADLKPIGQAIEGHIVEGFNLKGRRATIILDGGYQLEIRSLDFKPLFLRLMTPTGILEE